jgi:hypothetical protein
MRLLRDLEEPRKHLPTPDAALVELLSTRARRWLQDDSTIETLLEDLERLAGTSFSSHERQAEVALAVARLRDLAEAVPGMTVNERLSAFGLLERWDRATEQQRDRLRNKLGMH